MDTSDEYKLLDPKSKIVMYIKSAMIIAVCIISLAALIVLSDGAFFREWYGYVITALVAIIILYMLIRPLIFYTHYRYYVSDDMVDVYSGVFFRSRVLVPIERVHQVEVNRGPISNAFGLANVTVTTAGGTAVICYLEQPVADSVAQYLNDKVNGIIRDRESE